MIVADRKNVREIRDMIQDTAGCCWWAAARA